MTAISPHSITHEWFTVSKTKWLDNILVRSN